MNLLARDFFFRYDLGLFYWDCHQVWSESIKHKFRVLFLNKSKLEIKVFKYYEITRIY